MWVFLNQKIKYLLSICSLLMFSSLSHLAWAEGNCPQGMYPVGGQGVMGCAPIPNYGGGGGGYQAPTYYTYAVVGAIASGSNGVVGHSFAKVFRGDLRAKAVKDCQEKGGTNCEVWFTYQETQCATVGQAKGTTKLYGQVTGRDHTFRKKFGRESVLSQCQRDGFRKDQCEVVYERCSGLM